MSQVTVCASVELLFDVYMSIGLLTVEMLSSGIGQIYLVGIVCYLMSETFFSSGCESLSWFDWFSIGLVIGSLLKNRHRPYLYE